MVMEDSHTVNNGIQSSHRPKPNLHHPLSNFDECPRTTHTDGESKFPEPLCSPIRPASPMHHAHLLGSPLSSPMTPLSYPSPSPGAKRFVGLPNNARNDIYMKTLLNSPYHKSYTPLTATPAGCGPSYQTPIRGKGEITNASPRKEVAWTPQGKSIPTSAKKFATPKMGIVNPFDSGVDGLHLPAYISPGFFTVASTPASEKGFRWSIEHIAELNPVDIDEMPLHQAHHVVPDKETEERAQRAIEHFFANNIIVPSPWSDSREKKKHVLPSTPAAYGSGGDQAAAMLIELQGSIQKCLPPKQGTQDAMCQTTLSLPMNFDLQTVLSAYMTQDTEEGNQQEMLSTSSLRRKLFFNGDTSSVAPSPVKGLQHDLFTDQPVIEAMSPMFVAPSTPQHHSSHKNTPAFSSSPIKSAGTPQRSRSSPGPEFMATPELSPIVKNAPKRTIRKTAGKFGLTGAPRASLDFSPVSDSDSGTQPLKSPGSPIPFSGLSPEHEEEGDFRPKFVDSPGFSPICPPKTPIRKILRRSQEESYIQEDGYSTDEEKEAVTPSDNHRLHGDGSSPFEASSPLQRTPMSRVSPLSKHNCSDIKHSEMDFELSSLPTMQTQLRGNLSWTDSHDFSQSHDDLSCETHLGTSLTNQDTGYQTASLQSTNQESVSSLHTNLTNQFSSLPFNVTNLQMSMVQDSDIENKALNRSITKDKPSASEIAKAIMKRAGDDLAKYGSIGLAQPVEYATDGYYSDS